MKAIQYDGARGAYPDPHLEHALHLIGENGDKGEIRNEIEAYVALYQREHMGTLPTNMAILYDYLTLVGDTNWYAAPAAVVSTKNVEAIRINSSVVLPSNMLDLATNTPSLIRTYRTSYRCRCAGG